MSDRPTREGTLQETNRGLWNVLSPTNPKSDQSRGAEVEVGDEEVQIVILRQARIRNTTVAYVKSVALEETGTLTRLKELLGQCICNYTVGWHAGMQDLSFLPLMIYEDINFPVPGPRPFAASDASIEPQPTV